MALHSNWTALWNKVQRHEFDPLTQANPRLHGGVLVLLQTPVAPFEEHHSAETWTEVSKCQTTSDQNAGKSNDLVVFSKFLLEEDMPADGLLFLLALAAYFHSALCKRRCGLVQGPVWSDLSVRPQRPITLREKLDVNSFDILWDI